jgi:lipocalin-like protein
VHRRKILKAVTLLGFALLTADAVAQEKSLKEQLVGAWTLVSIEVTEKEGTKRQEFGPVPKGVMILDPGGRYATVWGRRGRNKFNAPEKFRQITPDAEFGQAAREFGANFGTWSVNEADKSLIQRWEGAVVLNVEGQETKASINLAGDELKLSSTYRRSYKTDAVYRR